MRGGSTPPTYDPPSFTPSCQDVLEQLDGNISLNSTISVNISHSVTNGYPIPPFWGNRPEKSQAARLQPTRKVLRRDNRAIQALTLPKVLNFFLLDTNFYPVLNSYPSFFFFLFFLNHCPLESRLLYDGRVL